MSGRRDRNIFVAAGTRGDELYLRRFSPSGPGSGEAILCIHGAVETGRIFASADGRKGLAPFLATCGYDVFVADLRGRGSSRPPLGPKRDHSQTESIVEDLPALYSAVSAVSAVSAENTGGARQHWIAHSWGGVLAQSCLLRFPELAVASVTCFGTKRSISVFNLPKLVGVDLIWNGIGLIAARALGYLPAKRLRLGAQNEPLTWYRQCARWVDPKQPWVDPVDGFDYAAAARRNRLPRTRHFAGAADRFLGHPVDVARFIGECNQPASSMTVLSRAHGQRHDYGHIDMLTHPDAVEDHFPMVSRWLGTPDE